MEGYCYRKRRDERLAKEWANKDRYRPSRGVPEPREPLPRGRAVVRNIQPHNTWTRQRPPIRPVMATSQTSAPRRGVHFGSARGVFAGRAPSHDQYEFRSNSRSFGSQRDYRPRFPPRGARIPHRRQDRVDFANPSFEQMARHWFDSFCANPSVESFAHSASRF